MTAAMDRARRSPLRFLAPLGLVAFALAFLIVVVSADLSDGGDSNGANREAEQRDLRGDSREARRERREDRENRLPDEVYVVKGYSTLIHANTACPDLVNPKGDVITCKIKGDRVVDSNGIFLNSEREKPPLCPQCVR